MTPDGWIDQYFTTESAFNGTMPTRTLSLRNPTSTQDARVEDAIALAADLLREAASAMASSTRAS